MGIINPEALSRGQTSIGRGLMGRKDPEKTSTDKNSQEKHGPEKKEGKKNRRLKGTMHTNVIRGGGGNADEGVRRKGGLLGEKARAA